MLLGLATNTPLPSGITNRAQVVRPPEDEQEQHGDTATFGALKLVCEE